MWRRWQEFRKFLTPGLGIKRWLFLLGVGITAISLAIAQLIVQLYRYEELPGGIIPFKFFPIPWRIFAGLVVGIIAIAFGRWQLSRTFLAPFALQRRASLIDPMHTHPF